MTTTTPAAPPAPCRRQVTPATLTVTGIAATNKVYDGTTAATLTGTPGALAGVVSGDTVTLGGTAVGTFVDANVGTGKLVTVSGQTLGGASAGNYTLTEPTTTANITGAGTATALLSSGNPSGLGSRDVYGDGEFGCGHSDGQCGVPGQRSAFQAQTPWWPGRWLRAQRRCRRVPTPWWPSMRPTATTWAAPTPCNRWCKAGWFTSQTNLVSSIVDNGDGTLTLNFVGDAAGAVLRGRLLECRGADEQLGAVGQQHQHRHRPQRPMVFHGDQYGLPTVLSFGGRRSQSMTS